MIYAHKQTGRHVSKAFNIWHHDLCSHAHLAVFGTFVDGVAAKSFSDVSLASFALFLFFPYNVYLHLSQYKVIRSKDMFELSLHKLASSSAIWLAYMTATSLVSWLDVE